MNRVQEQRRNGEVLPFHLPLDPSLLNVTEKRRANLFSWRGQFTPQFAESLLSAYAPTGATILDPFAGSGTVLLESGRLGFSALGFEVNPAAVLLAKTYELINASGNDRESLLESAEHKLQDYIPESLPLFANGSQVLHLTSDIYVGMLQSVSVPETRLLLETFGLIIDFAWKKNGSRNIWTTWMRFKALIRGLPESPNTISVDLADARRLPCEDHSVDFVLTSPPYINVFNYHQYYRASAEALGWRPLRAAQSEIGSNRKFRQNRFLTVVQYCLDIACVLSELQRVCTEHARIVFVVGRESNVRKTAFYNSKIVSALATEVLKFDQILWQERMFANKFGKEIYEDILHLCAPATQLHRSEVIHFAACAAKDILIDAKRRASTEVLGDLHSAIDQADEVKVSPIFEKRVADPTSLMKSYSNITVHLRGRFMDTVFPTPHLEKLNASLSNDKLPDVELPSLQKALKAYERWIALMQGVPSVDRDQGVTLEEVVRQLVDLLNKYKTFIDLQVIFDSPGDFLYRQKGQLKLDNTVIEEFLPHLLYKCIPALREGYDIGPNSCFSAIYFDSSLGRIKSGGGPQIRKKNQDFAISRRLFIKTSHNQDFSESVNRDTYLGYIVAECKTNLDKTMFQEATATAHDVKSAVPGAKYYLLCEYLDMPPVSTASTDIDEVIILKKAKRTSANIRRSFSTTQGRAKARPEFERFLTQNPFRPDVFLRFVNHIIGVLFDEDPIEDDVLQTGYF